MRKGVTFWLVCLSLGLTRLLGLHLHACAGAEAGGSHAGTRHAEDEGAMAAALCFLPMALNTGAGAEGRRPLPAGAPAPVVRARAAGSAPITSAPQTPYPFGQADLRVGFPLL